MRELKLNAPVRIQTQIGCAYHAKTGRIMRITNGAGTDIRKIPTGSPDAQPYWYHVRFDIPVDNHGKRIESDMFTANELVSLE